MGIYGSGGGGLSATLGRGSSPAGTSCSIQTGTFCNAGGTSVCSNNDFDEDACGGGGAGGVGTCAAGSTGCSTTSGGGVGGAGRTWAWTGASVLYAGGGGGAGNRNKMPAGGLGGSGVGGSGGTYNTAPNGLDGAYATGSGGGGGSYYSNNVLGNAGNGASGVVLLHCYTGQPPPAPLPTPRPTPLPTATAVAVAALSFTVAASAPNFGGYPFSNIQAQDAQCWLGPDEVNTYPGGGNPAFFFVLDMASVRVVTSIIVQQCAAWCNMYAVYQLQISTSNDATTYGSPVTVTAAMCTNSVYPQPLQTLSVGLTGRYIKVLVKTYNPSRSMGADFIGLLGY